EVVPDDGEAAHLRVHAVDRAALEVLVRRRDIGVLLGCGRQHQRRQGARRQRGAAQQLESRTTIRFQHGGSPPYWMTTTTRRLRDSFICAAVGTSRSPPPLADVVIEPAGTPFWTSTFFTASARACDSCMFSAGEPTVSANPVTVTLALVFVL